MKKIPGCWENLFMVYYALKEAKAQKYTSYIIFYSKV